MNDTLFQKKQNLLDRLRQFNSIAVAFSGGVDSAVLAKAAVEARREFCVAMYAISDSMPQGEPERILHLAQEIGITCRFIPTDELSLPDYVANQANRCYACKKHVFQKLIAVAKENGFPVVVEGSNADDEKDFRPGARAVLELGVLSPLTEIGLTKAEIRELAREWNLSVADRPATPCLSSRIAYGVEITSERLRRIDNAELMLSELGITPLRVRTFANDIAVIETSEEWIPKLTQPELREQIVQTLLNLGFTRVNISMTPFKSGSMNIGIVKN